MNTMNRLWIGLIIGGYNIKLSTIVQCTKYIMRSTHCVVLVVLHKANVSYIVQIVLLVHYDLNISHNLHYII